jgi:hypothetical protein
VGIEVEEFAGVRRRQHRAGTDTHPACPACPACPAENYAVSKIDVWADAVRDRFLLKKRGTQHRPCACCGWLASERTCVGGLARSLRCPSRLTGWPLIGAAATPRAPQITTTITSPHKVVVNDERRSLPAPRPHRLARRRPIRGSRRRMGAATAQLRQDAKCLSRQGLNSRRTAAKQPSVTPVALSVVPLRGPMLCCHVATHLPWCNLLVALDPAGVRCPTSRPWADQHGTYANFADRVTNPVDTFSDPI